MPQQKEICLLGNSLCCFLQNAVYWSWLYTPVVFSLVIGKKKKTYKSFVNWREIVFMFMLLSCFSIQINVFYSQMLAGFFLLCNWDVMVFVCSVFLTESCLWGVTVDRILCTIKGKTDPQTDTSSNGITRSSSSLLGMNHLTVSVKPCLSKPTSSLK